MKQLLLIRHAKATHESGYVDFERPLKPSGILDAETIAARLREHHVVPKLLIASPALRTLTTANIFTQHLSLPQAQTNKNIYEAELYALIDVVTELPDEYMFVGIVGHNPGLSQLLYYFTHDVRDMNTCAAVLIAFDATKWGDIRSNSGSVAYYTSPNEE